MSPFLPTLQFTSSSSVLFILVSLFIYAIGFFAVLAVLNNSAAIIKKIGIRSLDAQTESIAKGVVLGYLLVYIAFLPLLIMTALLGALPL